MITIIIRDKENGNFKLMQIINSVFVHDWDKKQCNGFNTGSNIYPHGEIVRCGWALVELAMTVLLVVVVIHIYI